MPQTAVNAPSARSESRPDNRPVYTLLTLVLSAIVVLGWYAFFSAPPAPIKPQAIAPAGKVEKEPPPTPIEKPVKKATE